MNNDNPTTGELEELAQEWAADDRKWNTQDVVAVNLIAFAKRWQQSQPKPATGERFVMRDHAIFDTQANAFIGAGDACYMLNAHNAALAAEQNLRADWNYVIEELEKQLTAERKLKEEAQDGVLSMQDKLAAEREKVKELQDEINRLKR